MKEVPGWRASRRGEKDISLWSSSFLYQSRRGRMKWRTSEKRWQKGGNWRRDGMRFSLLSVLLFRHQEMIRNDFLGKGRTWEGFVSLSSSGNMMMNLLSAFSPTRRLIIPTSFDLLLLVPNFYGSLSLSPWTITPVGLVQRLVFRFELTRTGDKYNTREMWKQQKNRRWWTQAANNEIVTGNEVEVPTSKLRVRFELGTFRPLCCS